MYVVKKNALSFDSYLLKSTFIVYSTFKTSEDEGSKFDHIDFGFILFES